MRGIYNLTLLYEDILKQQNNKFLFSVGDKPFELLNHFIENELKPPLTLIKKYYDLIEEQSIEKIKTLVDNFPDCLSIIKEKFIENRIDFIYRYANDINSLILEYKNIINDDINDYVNKLSYYSYINGLNFYQKPCNESYCKINRADSNNIRRLNDINQNNNNIKYSNYKTKNETKINPRKLNEYNYTMAALSKNDVIPYIKNIQKNILEFNKTYIGDELKNIENSFKKFISKVNGSCLTSLKKSFSMKLHKFQTIITEDKMETLKKVLFKQYNDIEPYIYESSNIIKESIENFTQLIIDSSNLYPIFSNNIYEKSLIYLICLVIQSKINIIL